PPGQAGGNRQRVFCGAPLQSDPFCMKAAQQNLSPDEVGVRYLAWMAMGGTKTRIPNTVLTQIARLGAFGKPRKFPPGFGVPPSGNMLANARILCGQLRETNPLSPQAAPGLFVSSSGDLDLWTRVCYAENPAPDMLVLKTEKDGKTSVVAAQLLREGYPPGMPL